MVRFCSSESAIAICDSYNNRPRKHHRPSHRHQLRRFSYSDLESATSAFSPANLLGKGSHGAFYRASFDGGKVVAAVKRSLAASPGTAENEMEILSNLRGSGLVNLLGYGVNPATNRPLLVVEHMPNGTLYDLLHKTPEPPGWIDRVRFSLEVARAIGFLHESNPPVLHRDIKSSNVLVDRRGRARLGDLGLALRGHMEEVRTMGRPPVGNLGYLDPFYVEAEDVGPKNDVFSFGILLLEMISGRQVIDVRYSPSSVGDWALPLIKAERYEEICDSRIWSCGVGCKMMGKISVMAGRCVRSTVERRPTMGEVVDCLKGVYKGLMLEGGKKVRRGSPRSRKVSCVHGS